MARSKLVDKGRWIKLISDSAFKDTDPSSTNLVKAAISSLNQGAKDFAGTVKFDVVTHFAGQLLDVLKDDDAESVLVDRLSILKAEIAEVLVMLADANVSDAEVAEFLATLKGESSEATGDDAAA